MRPDRLYLLDIVEAADSIQRFLSGMTQEAFRVHDRPVSQVCPAARADALSLSQRQPAMKRIFIALALLGAARPALACGTCVASMVDSFAPPVQWWLLLAFT
jgi:hypothetical protein